MNPIKGRSFAAILALSAGIVFTAQAQSNGGYNANSYYYGNYAQQPQQYQQYYQAQRQAYQPYQPQQVQQAAPWYPQQSQASYGYSQNQQQQQPLQQPRYSSVAPASRSRHAVQPRAEKQQPTSHADTSRWYSSFDEAWTRAYQQGRPLVVLFVHHGCPVCDQMDRNLAQPGAMDTLASAVKARVEFTENPAVVNRFGVKLTPTFLVLTPQGAEAYREVGALSVDRLRQIQPAIDSLVAAPPANVKNSKQISSADKTAAVDEPTSTTVASL